MPCYFLQKPAPYLMWWTLIYPIFRISLIYVLWHQCNLQIQVNKTHYNLAKRFQTRFKSSSTPCFYYNEWLFIQYLTCWTSMIMFKCMPEWYCWFDDYFLFYLLSRNLAQNRITYIDVQFCKEMPQLQYLYVHTFCFSLILMWVLPQ